MNTSQERMHIMRQELHNMLADRPFVYGQAERLRKLDPNNPLLKYGECTTSYGFKLRNEADKIEIARNTVPYRALSHKECEKLWGFVRMLSPKKEAIFWKQTLPEALIRIKEIKSGGYVVSEPFYWGIPQEGYGQSVCIYDLGFNIDSLKKGSEETRALGRLELWETGGFSEEPLAVYKSRRGSQELMGFLEEREIPYRVE